MRVPGAVPVLLQLGCHSPDNALRAAALAALANYDDPAIAGEVSRRMAACPTISCPPLRTCWRRAGDGRSSSSRPIDARTIDPRTVPREIVEKLALFDDPRIKELITRHFGPVKPSTSAELQSQIARLAALVRSGAGIPKPGRQVFLDHCARCHILFGKGGKVGPDLTTYRRDDLDNMLLNIVNPSAEIREGYAGTIVATTDGRTLTGVVAEADKNVVVLRGGDGKELTLLA